MSFLDRKPYLKEVTEAEMIRVLGVISKYWTDMVNTDRPNVVLFKHQKTDIAWLDTVRKVGYIHI
jgi:hypothetical protein